MTSIQGFQKALYSQYQSDLSLPSRYEYFFGNPVQPVVPLDTAKKSVFILGAYTLDMGAACPLKEQRDGYIQCRAKINE